MGNKEIGGDFQMIIFFHYYPWDIVQKEFIDVLLEYAPDDRPYILEGEDFGDYPKALEAAERAFYDIKAGKYSLD